MADRHKNRTKASEAARQRAMHDASLDIDSKEFKLSRARKARRSKTSKSVIRFAHEYCTACDGGFLRTFPPYKMLRILHKMQTAVEADQLEHLVIPRGHGKTSFVKIVVAWAIATGKRHFLEVVAANGKKASSILRDIFNLFARSPKLKDDFPEICLPIAKLNGKTQRCKSITVDGISTDMKVSADTVNFPRVKGYENTGAILMAVGFKANARGAVVGSLRPDLMVFDDLQDREMAKSSERVAEAIELIDGDFLGSAGHQGGISAFMTSTPIEADDLSEKISANPYWHTQKFKMLDKMPKEWMKEDHGLWGRYAEIFKECIALSGDPTSELSAFYKKHQKEMSAGASVLNDKNFTRHEVDAVQHAMNLLIRYGKKNFDAEYQMEPQRLDALFEITPKLVLSRVRTGTARGAMLDGCVFTAAATDINPSYALSTAICRFDIARSCFVTAYFVQRISVDSKVNDTAYNSKIYDLLCQHTRAIRDLGIPLNAYGIDCGGKQWEAVTRFSTQSQSVCGLQIVPMAGRAGRSWNPNVKTRIRNAINDTVFCQDQQGRVWLAFDADTYREQMQRAWGAEVGSPGGCSLYDGDITHTEFAVQISNERLIAKQKLLDGRIDYLWKTKEPHDFGDCLSMCYALAGSRNISGGTSIALASAANANVTAVNEAHATATNDGIVIGCDF